MAARIGTLAPEWAKAAYRLLRGWALSLNLRPSEEFALSAGELAASRLMSVIIPVHDAPRVTLRCLCSLEMFGGEAEIIVVDDGSKQEQTRLMLDEFCARKGWKLVRHGEPQGHSRASEAGVAVSSRKYLCLLNSDTVVTPCSWAGVARTFEGSADVAVVGPSTSHTPTPQCVSRASKCRHYWTDGQIWSFAKKYTAKFEREAPVELPMVGGFAFFMRRAAWDETGGFDKGLPDYGNESELCRRVAQLKRRILWTKSSYIHHLGSESYGRVLGMDVIRKRCVAADSYIEKKWKSSGASAAEK